MGPKEIYLILYNLCACTGWFLVLAKALQSLAVGIPEDGLFEALANVYATEGLADLLFYSQTAALLEIAHAGLGLVRSPLMVTAMQVGSRIVALVAVTYSADAQSKLLFRSLCRNYMQSVRDPQIPFFLQLNGALASWSCLGQLLKSFATCFTLQLLSLAMPQRRHLSLFFGFDTPYLPYFIQLVSLVN